MRAVLLLAFALTACASDTTPPAAPAADNASASASETVETRTLTSGGYAAAKPERPQAVAVKSADEYAAKWEQTVGGGTPPQVDFAGDSVVILLAGSRPTGGYSVEVRGARLEGRTLVIDAAVKGPPPDSMVTQAFTSPFAAIAVNTKDFDGVRWTP
jgi:outer membrane receptor protein involved in Fe transport